MAVGMRVVGVEHCLDHLKGGLGRSGGAGAGIITRSIRRNNAISSKK